MPTPQILIYNIKDHARLRPVLKYLNHAGIWSRIVQPYEFHETLGFLLGLPGHQKSPSINLGGAFSEEMLVLNSFTAQELDAFLAFFHENGLAPVALKALVTPINCHWSSLMLHDELLKEAQAFRKKS